jgi:16S rRNA (uracil1498-N3)-methyltransferase
MPAFYIPFETDDKYVEVTGDAYHHITHVLRHKKHDIFSVLNGKGSLATGKIVEIDKKSLRLDVYDIKFADYEKPRIACAFSLLKNKNDLLIVEKLTELGVSHLFPFFSKNTVIHPKENYHEKLRKVAISAIKQCENPYLPLIQDVVPLQSALSAIYTAGYTPIVASEKKPENNLYAMVSCKKDVDMCIIIGPEGGFAPDEFEHFEKNDITSVSLVKNTLRAETAAITAVSILSIQRLYAS